MYECRHLKIYIHSCNHTHTKRRKIAESQVVAHTYNPSTHKEAEGFQVHSEILPYKNKSQKKVRYSVESEVFLMSFLCFFT